MERYNICHIGILPGLLLCFSVSACLSGCGGKDEVVPITSSEIEAISVPSPDLHNADLHSPDLSTKPYKKIANASALTDVATSSRPAERVVHKESAEVPHLRAGTEKDNARTEFVGFADDSAEAIKVRSAPGDPIAGKTKSELCQGCHGETGNSTESQIPKLAGQYGVYIAKQLRNYQSGVRANQIMSAMAATINDEDLADISAYFASQQKMQGKKSRASPTSGNSIGEKLFLYGDMSRMMVACINCHGVNGKGKTPDNSTFPVIGGQHKDYLRVQLLAFKKDQRNNSPGGVMNIITQKLTNAEITALAEYMSSL